MDFENLLSRINLRQIVIHTIAFLFIVNAVKIFSFLSNVELVKTVFNSEGDFHKGINGFSGFDIQNILIIRMYFTLLGILIGFFISLFVSKKRGWFWVNSVFSLLFLTLLLRYNLTGIGFFKYLNYYIGLPFNNYYIKFVIIGTIYIMIACFFFFNKRINSFIK